MHFKSEKSFGQIMTIVFKKLQKKRRKKKIQPPDCDFSSPPASAETNILGPKMSLFYELGKSDIYGTKFLSLPVILFEKMVNHSNELVVFLAEIKINCC